MLDFILHSPLHNILNTLWAQLAAKDLFANKLEHEPSYEDKNTLKPEAVQQKGEFIESTPSLVRVRLKYSLAVYQVLAQSMQLEFSVPIFCQGFEYLWSEVRKFTNLLS